MSCSFDGCERDAWCKGFCSKHYYYNKRHGVLPGKICKIDGCESPAYRRGMCNKHSLRDDRNGDPLVSKKAANGECCTKRCIVDGCTSHGKMKIGDDVYCSLHGGRMRRNGNAETVLKLGNGEATPERKKETARRATDKYRKTPHGRMRARFNSAKRRVLQGVQKGVGEITKEQFLELWNTPNCHICGTELGEDRTIDHVMPLSKGGSNRLDNLKMAHLSCNQKKSAKIQKRG